MTLAKWFRMYVFNPLTRSLRIQPRKLPTWTIILVGQVSTMALIGLCHGITWNFLIWGLWHGIGLFAHNRWSEWARLHFDPQAMGSFTRAAMSFGAWLMTFLFVTLGWVWFAIPDPALAVRVFRRLFGL